MLTIFARAGTHMQTLTETVTAAEARKLILAGEALDGLQVEERLDLSKCKELTELPPGLKVVSLNLSDCTRLVRLPQGLRVRHLNLRGCTGLRALPEGLSCYHLDLQGTHLRSLPAGLRV